MANVCNVFLNENTPVNMPLKGKYKKSFGYVSLRNRMPEVFSAIINSLKVDTFDSNNEKEVQYAVEELNVLLKELLDNKSLRKINGTSKLSSMWNQILDEKFKADSSVTWFGSEWLFTENYLYMRIMEIFENTKTLKNYDPFRQLKYKAFDESETTMVTIAEFLILQFSNKGVNNTKLKTLFSQMLKICLWGNRFDLSLNIGKSKNITEDALETIVSLDQYILANDTDEIWEILNVSNNKKVVDIIMDNSAYELFTDLCLADFLLTFGLADVVIFHGKSIPWFVSDVTKPDFEDILNRLENKCMSGALREIGKRWNNYYKMGKFILKCEYFWTLPHTYSKMGTKDPKLYNELSNSQLLIFKGDLNYRKLIGDINWVPSTTFKDALREFQPTVVVALRTLKCDCVCGLNSGYESKIKEKDRDNWKISGNYGVIHLNK